MKIRCDVCERAEATVLCCADEAALCYNCDEKIHAANKLAEKHQRIPLINPSTKTPSCDICQEKSGYFFCLEDRALLCRHCDLWVHSSSPFASSHQRFLITGVKIPLQGSTVFTSNNNNSCTAPTGNNFPSLPETTPKKRRQSETFPSVEKKQCPRPHWPLDEIFGQF